MSCLPIPYSLSITGDCTNSSLGQVSISFGTFVGAPPYIVTSPISGPSGSIGAGGTYTEGSLSAGTYTYTIQDSCVTPSNQTISVNVYVSSGTCVSITGLNNTTCGANNGVLTATTSNFYGSASFYLYEDTTGYVTSGTSLTQNRVFSSLSAGTYYVIANDGGGCTGQSETVIVQSSTTVDYGLYVINDAGCSVNSGKVFVTGLTGNPPFTYLWSPGSQTTSSITGLTPGAYSVTVTDNTGCAVSKSAIVAEVLPVGISAMITETPNCNAADGEITVYVTGGTSPYTYAEPSLGTYFSFNSNYTFTNVGSGNYTITVTDAGLCTTTQNVTVLTAGGFTVTSLTYPTSVCTPTGTLLIQLLGGTPNYTYSLVKTGGPTTSATTSSSTYSFPNLGPGEYTITITDNGPCVFTETFIIESNADFEITTSVTGTTCGGDAGSVLIEVDGSFGPYTYSIDGTQIYSTSLSSHTYTNIVSGFHTVQVIDGLGCIQTEIIDITSSSNVNFFLTSTNSTLGNNGTINAYITDGLAPFTLTWSPNVNGQTGTSVTNLSAGTYTLIVTDSNGCSKTQTVIVNGVSSLSSYQTYNVCDADFMNYGEIITKGPQQMLLEGFYSLTSGDTDCVLNESIFEASVSVSGVTKTKEFYTGTTLNDFPGDDLWINTIVELLKSYDGIGDVIVDIETNEIIINNDCKSNVNLIDGNVIINLVIYYDISCLYCGPPPTPTPTPTSTPTPTLTSTPTPTPTQTLTSTPTPTPTPTNTPTQSSLPSPVNCNMEGYTYEINKPIIT
jgi:hypothetical protein